jgi:two-component system, OmpR family, sensor kinase
VSLRSRLLVLLLVLLAGGLVVSDVVTAALLRNYMLHRVDTQLRAAEATAAQRLAPIGGFDGRPRGEHGGGPNGGPDRPSDTDIRVLRIDSGGKVADQLSGPFNNPFTVVPASFVTKARSAKGFFDATLDGAHYRALADTSASGDVVVALAPTHDIDATFARLRMFEVLVTVGVLGLATFVSLRLVRVGLRPLRDMADTADAIATGDVDRRVTVSGGAEVATLGSALNAAFDARHESEAKLRTFIADASHELRTPLTSIRGYAELLRSGAAAEADERDRAVQRIESEATRMGGLVNDMLMLARLDQGRPLARERVDLAAIVADAVADARAVDPGREITLDAAGPVVVSGDDSRLRQILTNLLANARHHTPPGTPVDVRVGASGGTARVDVIDAGPGIPVDLRTHVFDRFWRGDAAHGRAGRTDGGSGLGLSIVAALASAHGGRAWLEPSERGAHFVVTIPVATAS